MEWVIIRLVLKRKHMRSEEKQHLKELISIFVYGLLFLYGFSLVIEALIDSKYKMPEDGIYEFVSPLH